MKTPRNIFKKFFALFAAGFMLLTFAPEVLADQTSEPGGMEMSEVQEADGKSGQKLEVEVNFSELEAKIIYANGLNKREYSKESWDALEKAMAEGLGLLNTATDQKTVSDAADAIEEAIDALVKIDYSKLEKALGVIYNIMDENSAQHDIWEKIDTAAENARTVLISGNQETVDKTTAELEALAEEFFKMGTVSSEPEVIVNTVEVEVPPSDDFCNIPGHKTWPVLFFLSLALNIAMAGLFVHLIIKKRNSEDDIPLVNYDIDDDMDGFDDFDDDFDSEEIDDDDESDKDNNDED